MVAATYDAYRGDAPPVFQLRNEGDGRAVDIRLSATAIALRHERRDLGQGVEPPWEWVAHLEVLRSDSTVDVPLFGPDSRSMMIGFAAGEPLWVDVVIEYSNSYGETVRTTNRLPPPRERPGGVALPEE